MDTLLFKTKKIINISLFIALMLLLTVIAKAQNGVGVNTNSPKSNFEVNGSVGQTITTITTNTTLDETQSIVICNNGSNPITVTLPTVSLCSGRIYTIKKSATTTAIVVVSGTIDGTSNITLSETSEAVTLFSNGTEWKTMNNYNSPLTWKTIGNSSTDSATNFIGTTNAMGFNIKTNDTTRMSISRDGATYFGDATNNMKVEADGTLIFNGTATVWDDLRVAMDRGSNATSITFLPGASSGPEIWYFRNNSGVEAMSFTVQLPHSWKEGSTIYPHIHWTPSSTGTGNAEWNFEYTWANYDAASPQAFPAITTSTVVTNGPFTLGTHMITALTSGNAGISATGKRVSSILICRIWRNSANAADTYGGNLGLLSLDFHYEINTFGSHLEYVK